MRGISTKMAGMAKESTGSKMVNGFQEGFRTIS